MTDPKDKVQPSETKTQDSSVKVDSQPSAGVDAKDSQDQKPASDTVKLNTIFAFKMGMSNIYDDQNRQIPVTFLQYKDLKVTQIKRKEVEGYDAVQVAIENSKKPNKSLSGHLKKASVEKGVSQIRETRQNPPEGIKVGQKVSIDSLKKGDDIFVTGVSKGHGFSGVVKRWGFAGGPASHGAEKQRTTGSIANTATQGRVFPGKKLPGRFGCDRTTQKSQVMDVVPQKGVILVKGPVAGAKKSLVEIRRCEHGS